MSNIYHYCRLETFDKIIRNKCIRLSDLNKTNDYMEKRWIFNVLEQAMNEELAAQGLSDNLLKSFFSNKKKASHFSYLLDLLEDYLNTSTITLISCFSQSGDLLSQWRAYAEDGYGVSIGFNYDLIKKLKNRKKNVDVGKVIYNKVKQINKLKEIINHSIEFLRDLKHKNEVIDNKSFHMYFINNFDLFCEHFAKGIEYASCYIKNPAFKEEKEVRIVFEDAYDLEKLPDKDKHPFNIKQDIGQFCMEKIQYYFRNNMLVAYADIHFEKLVDFNIIQEIVLGPKSKLTKSGVKAYLLSNGYDINQINVRESRATLQ